MVLFLEYIRSRTSCQYLRALEYCFSAAVYDAISFGGFEKDNKEFKGLNQQEYYFGEIIDLERIAKEMGSRNGRPNTRRFLLRAMQGKHQKVLEDLKPYIKRICYDFIYKYYLPEKENLIKDLKTIDPLYYHKKWQIK